MRKLIALWLSLFALPLMAANILSNTDHVSLVPGNTVAILGGTGIIVDQTCPTGTTPGVSCFSVGGPTFVPFATLIADATNGSATLYSAGTATVTNNVPYKVLNQSSTGYTLAGLDQANYAALTANDEIYEMAYCGIPQTNEYPAVAASTVLPSLSSLPQIPVGQSGCGYAAGIEFSMTSGYKGFDTSSASSTTEVMSGVLAVMRSNHPTWTWSDIKGALRQTADAWATGYAAFHASPLGFGYGNINYDSANAIASTASIFLQAPGMSIANHGYYATVSIYPFVTARRAKEVVYIGGVWPAASSINEMTAAQIAAAGGTKVIDDGGATGVQSFTYAPAATGSAVFTAITLDSSGNGSRVESFSSIPQSFLVGSACLQ